MVIGYDKAAAIVFEARQSNLLTAGLQIEQLQAQVAHELPPHLMRTTLMSTIRELPPHMSTRHEHHLRAPLESTT